MLSLLMLLTLPVLGALATATPAVTVNTSATATPAPFVDESTPKPSKGEFAWVNNPEGGYAPIAQTVDGPLSAILYNGAQVNVMDIIDNTEIPLAYISIGWSDEQGLYKGYLPAHMLSSQAVDAQLPTATALDDMPLDSTNGHLGFYVDLFKGQRVTLLGRERARWFLETSDAQGSELMWDLKPDEEFVDFLRENRPEGFLETGEEYLALRDARDALDVEAYEAGGWANMPPERLEEYKEMNVRLGDVYLNEQPEQ